MASLTKEFAYLVLAIVSEIPEGQVATYGQIASLAGYPKNARLVGRVMSHASTYGRYPCHRVVNAQGKCAANWKRQPELLKAEGVLFRANGTVNLKDCQWHNND